MNLFGIPYYHAKILPEFFNKTEIVETIKRNYEIEPLRNKWNINSKLHHSNNDENNCDFEKIDFSQLMPIYIDHIKIFFDMYNFFNCPVKVQIEEANYTCMTKNNYMTEHNHPVPFVGVHYIKFNKDKHSTIKFINPNSFTVDDSKKFYGEYVKLLNKENFNNFYFFKDVLPKIEENDFIIVPGVLKHSVPEFNETDELRMSIAINISVFKD
jgi:hypothetical protein